MSKLLAAASVFVLVFAEAAAQQAPLPAVETMTCDQMLAEMTTAGQQMNAQLDPEFARQAQQDAQQLQGGGNSGAPDSRQAAADAERNRANRAAQVGRVQDAMVGLDQNRLMALMERFESERCPTPQ